MKIKYIVVFVFALLFMSACSVSSTTIAERLSQQTESIDMDQLNQEIHAIYDNEASKAIIAEKPIMLLTLISDERIKSATLSDPIPVFQSNEKYKKGDDYKSKLTLVGWDIVVRSGGNAIAVFSIRKDQERYTYDYTKGEEYAILYTEALNRIDQDSALALPLGEYCFLADGTDTVVPLVAVNEATGEVFPPRSFKEFNAAVNKSIDYYSEIAPEDLEIGGNKVLMDALYR